MKRKILAFILIIFLILIGFLICYLMFWKSVLKTEENKVCLKDNCYMVEIARTQEEKEKGLMYRKNLGEGQGMLFINDEEGIYPFWMKNMRFPLDIIWLDKDFKVAFIVKNAQPCVDECNNIIPDKPARYVLELNAGEANRIGLQPGDKANYENGNRSIVKN